MRGFHRVTMTAKRTRYAGDGLTCIINERYQRQIKVELRRSSRDTDAVEALWTALLPTIQRGMTRQCSTLK